MPTVLNDQRPKARKAHRCEPCRSTIEPGVVYRRTTYLGDDGLYEWVTCPDCDPLIHLVWEWAGRPDEGIDEYSIIEWANDHRDDPEHGQAARGFLNRHPSTAPTTAEGETPDLMAALQESIALHRHRTAEGER